MILGREHSEGKGPEAEARKSEEAGMAAEASRGGVGCEAETPTGAEQGISKQKDPTKL